MYLNRIRVASFSMIEMLVVLVLSSMVVGIVYSAYYTVSKYQLELTRKYTRHGDLAVVYFTLKRDFDRSARVENIKGENALRFSAPHGEKVEYYFSQEAVVRKQAMRVDTFQCTSGKPRFLLEGREVRQDEVSLVDEIQMDINSLPDQTALMLHKHYDAASRMEPMENDTIQ
jgi:prepilin-type N-terminal cleavage/methylation domain-containing protein